MNETSDIIILSLNPYKETGAIIDGYSKEFGRIRLFARGIFKDKSKNAAAVQPITKSYCTFDIKGNSGTLHSAAIVDYYKTIKNDITKIAMASVFCEIIVQLSEPFIPDIPLFNALDYSLEGLKNQPPYLIGCWFLAQACLLAGISPEVDRCILCDSEKIAAISIKEGGFICSSCQNKTEIKKYDTDFYRMFRCINKADEHQLQHCAQLGQYTMEHLEVMIAIFSQFSGISLKSWEFLRRL